MMRAIHNERGFALAVSIMALVVIGALVAGAFFVGMQEQRVGRNTMKLQQAFAAADAGAQLTIANWNSNTNARLSQAGALQDSTLSFGGWLTDSTGWYRGTIRRMNRLMYLIESEGFSRDSTARQHLGLLVRLRPLELGINSAFKTQGPTTVSGATEIKGEDQIPLGWLGCSITDTLPGAAIDNAADITIQGAGAPFTGDPPVQQDPTINDSTLTHFGDATWDDLKSLYTNLLPAGNYQNVFPTQTGGVCNTGNPTNMGEPRTGVGAVIPCQTYFPITYVPGNLRIQTGVGQGVLIIEGDFEVQGNYEFRGPVIVKGAFRAQGSGINTPKFYGGVIAANVNDANNVLQGNPDIVYSSCAVFRALESSAPAALTRERSWANLY